MKIKKRYLFSGLLLGILFFAFIPGLIQSWEQRNIYSLNEYVEPHETAIVFGAGLNKEGRPSDALADRLIAAATLYNNGSIETILVSGDSITDEYYDEPAAMKTFLLEWGIPREDIEEDFAGASTYDTCIRAKEIWGLDTAILITQDFHLPRAIFTCNTLGVESIGVIADRQPYIFEEYYEQREWFAIYKAILDLYFLKPDYITSPTELPSS